MGYSTSVPYVWTHRFLARSMRDQWPNLWNPKKETSWSLAWLPKRIGAILKAPQYPKLGFILGCIGKIGSEHSHDDDRNDEKQEYQDISRFMCHYWLLGIVSRLSHLLSCFCLSLHCFCECIILHGHSRCHRGTVQRPPRIADSKLPVRPVAPRSKQRSAPEK